MDLSTSYTLEELSKLTSSKLVGDPDYRIQGVENLESASEREASFLANPLYLKQLKQSKAGVVFIKELPDFETSQNYLLSPDPSKSFQILIELFNDPSLLESGFTGIHPSAIIHPTADIADGVSIGPYTVIDQNVIIGPHTQILSHVHIGPHVQIGSHCLLHPQVSVGANCELKNSVILQPGAIIGSCGFGYSTSAKGEHQKLKHVGRVILEDNVEIGANTTIDRARFQVTHIHSGVKIDNLVQIGHGVHIGQNSIIVSQVGIAGSTKLGKYNVVAGQVGIVGHINIADHVTLAAKSGVTKSITKPGTYGGAPAVSQENYYKQIYSLRKLPLYASKIKKFEEKIQQVESYRSPLGTFNPKALFKKIFSNKS